MSIVVGKDKDDTGTVVSEITLPAGSFVDKDDMTATGGMEEEEDKKEQTLEAAKEASLQDLKLENAALRAILLEYQSRLLGSRAPPVAPQADDDEMSDGVPVAMPDPRDSLGVLVPSAPSTSAAGPGEADEEEEEEATMTAPSAPASSSAVAAAASSCSSSSTSARSHDMETVSCSAESKLQQSVRQMKKDLSTPEGTRHFFQQLKTRVEQPSFLTLLDEYNQSVMVHSKDQDDEVAILDLDHADWWTLVPGNDPLQPAVKHVDTTSLGGAYVFIEDTDVTDAIAEHVALYLRQIPASAKLTNKELQVLMSGAFAELCEKGPAGKLWDWGKFFYATYGWGAMTFNIYKDPTIARAVLRALWSLSKWTMVLMVG